MSGQTNSRRHLVERAVEAFGTAPPTELQPVVRAPIPVPVPGSPAPSNAPEAVVPVSAKQQVPAGDVSDSAVAKPLAVPAVAPSAPPRPVAIGHDLLRKAGLISPLGGARTRITEELGIIQHQIVRTVRATEAEEGRIRHMVLITSAKPGEGKTFCSLNIAARLALNTAEQVILVDADGKKTGALTELLEQRDAPGLRTLVGNAMQRPDTLVMPTAINRLFFMPFGAPPADDPGLPSGAMLAAALARLAAAMPGRILITDAPPCLATSEPTALASVAGQVVMVVKAEGTQRNEVEGALDMVESCPTIQLLLNRTHLVVQSGFGAYGYDGN